jgi:hypothetical protein
MLTIVTGGSVLALIGYAASTIQNEAEFLTALVSSSDTSDNEGSVSGMDEPGQIGIKPIEWDGHISVQQMPPTPRRRGKRNRAKKKLAAIPETIETEDDKPEQSDKDQSNGNGTLEETDTIQTESDTHQDTDYLYDAYSDAAFDSEMEYSSSDDYFIDDYKQRIGLFNVAQQISGANEHAPIHELLLDSDPELPTLEDEALF